MIKVALITEGVTDQIILKPIVENYFKETDFNFNSIQPTIDQTDKQANFGGWYNVLESCKNEDFEELLIWNEYIIIQIDTDVSEEKHFDVSKMKNGMQISNEQLYNNVITKLKSIIPTNIIEKYDEKFIFAIGIHSTECWLIGVINPKHSKKDTLNCLNKLNHILRKKNIGTINSNNKNNFKSKNTYNKLAKKIKNKKVIETYSKKNVGFIKFISQLKKIN